MKPSKHDAKSQSAGIIYGNSIVEWREVKFTYYQLVTLTASKVYIYEAL